MISHECVRLVTRDHFWSRDKDGGHINDIIRSAVTENLALHANFTVLCVMEAELSSIEVLRCDNKDFRRFLLP